MRKANTVHFQSGAPTGNSQKKLVVMASGLGGAIQPTDANQNPAGLFADLLMERIATMILIPATDMSTVSGICGAVLCIEGGACNVFNSLYFIHIRLKELTEYADLLEKHHTRCLGFGGRDAPPCESEETCLAFSPQRHDCIVQSTSYKRVIMCVCDSVCKETATAIKPLLSLRVFQPTKLAKTSYDTTRGIIAKHVGSTAYPRIVAFLDRCRFNVEFMAAALVECARKHSDVGRRQIYEARAHIGIARDKAEAHHNKKAPGFASGAMFYSLAHSCQSSLPCVPTSSGALDDTEPLTKVASGPKKSNVSKSSAVDSAATENNAITVSAETTTTGTTTPVSKQTAGFSWIDRVSHAAQAPAPDTNAEAPGSSSVVVTRAESTTHANKRPRGRPPKATVQPNAQ